MIWILTGKQRASGGTISPFSPFGNLFGICGSNLLDLLLLIGIRRIVKVAALERQRLGTIGCRLLKPCRTKRVEE